MEQSQDPEQVQLLEISKSEYEIRDGQPDIIGWKAFSHDESFVGVVTELLINTTESIVQYLVLDLSDNEWAAVSRSVCYPVDTVLLHEQTNSVILESVSALYLDELPGYEPGTPVRLPLSSAYTPYQLITRTYNEEAVAEAAVKFLLEKGVSSSSIRVTPFNPLNSVTDLMGNTNTEFLGDGSRDEYILSVAARNETEAGQLNDWLNSC